MWSLFIFPDSRHHAPVQNAAYLYPFLSSIHNVEWQFSSCRSSSFCHVSPLQWPEHAIYCENTVTSLDFSANNPSQQAVAMHDGSIAIYNVRSQHKKWHVISSRWGLSMWTEKLLHDTQKIINSMMLHTYNIALYLFVHVPVQWVSQQGLGSSVAAQVDSPRAEPNRRGEGRSSLLCVCRWQDQQVVCLQQWPWLHRYL